MRASKYGSIAAAGAVSSRATVVLLGVANFGPHYSRER